MSRGKGGEEEDVAPDYQTRRDLGELVSHLSSPKSIYAAPSFDEVYTQQASYVYNLARRMAGSPSEADDVFQETFLRVHRFLPQYRGDGLRTWLRRITVNVFCSRFRKHQKEVPQEEPFFEQASLADDPFTAWDERELGQQLHLALQKLSPEIRIAMVLRSVENLSYQEIAEQLEVPVGTVRSRLARARTQLLRLLEGVS